VRPRLLAAAALTVAAGAGLSACSGDSGLDLARQACVYVDRSLKDYELSVRAGSAAQGSHYLNLADLQLRLALPLAAQANSADGSWNSLMTTISESSTIDEGHLAPALKAQCAAANTNVNVNPQSPNVNPQSPG